MNKPKITIIINQNNDLPAISSVLKNAGDASECFVINNSVRNIEQYLENKKIKILNDISIDEAINLASGEYILLLNANDILTSDTIDNISYMIDFTDADIIKYNSLKPSNQNEIPTDKKCIFQYVFNKQNIIDYVFNSISEFCFKKDVIKNLDFSNQHSFITRALSVAKDMAVTKHNCIICQNNNILTPTDIIKNYNYNHDRLPEVFWKKYFKITTAQVIRQTIKNDDRKTFFGFCNQIPLKLIPLQYRFICYIFKKTNK